MSDGESQLEELEALKSVYEEKRVVFKREDGILSGSVIVEIPALSKSVRLYITDGSRSKELDILSPVKLFFSLPIDYPTISGPILSVECEWMNEGMATTIVQKMVEACKLYEGMPVLFYCCQTIIDTVGELESSFVGTGLCLDNTPYGLKHGLGPAELFKRVIDSSEKAADADFEYGCYDCEVCYENKLGKFCVRFSPCDHVFCFECTKAYLLERLNNAQIRPLECLSGQCSSTAPQAVIKAAIGEEAFDRYENLLLNSALSEMKDVVICPRESCMKIVVLGNSERYPNLGSCAECGFSFCVICKRAYHGVDACRIKIEWTVSVDREKFIRKYEEADTAQRLEMAKKFGGMAMFNRFMDNLQNETWISGNSRPCPNCSVNIEKNEGCNKMHCTKCNSMFCWLCNKILKKDDPYAHFNGDNTLCANRLFEGLESDDEEEWEPMFEAYDDDSDSDEELIRFE